MHPHSYSGSGGTSSQDKMEVRYFDSLCTDYKGLVGDLSSGGRVQWVVGWVAKFEVRRSEGRWTEALRLSSTNCSNWRRRSSRRACFACAREHRSTPSAATGMGSTKGVGVSETKHDADHVIADCSWALNSSRHRWQCPSFSVNFLRAEWTEHVVLPPGNSSQTRRDRDHSLLVLASSGSQTYELMSKFEAENPFTSSSNFCNQGKRPTRDWTKEKTKNVKHM